MSFAAPLAAFLGANATIRPFPAGNPVELLPAFSHC